MRRASLGLAFLLSLLALPAHAQRATPVDAWGVPTRPGLASLEILGINVVTWSYNYYVRGADFAAVYPKSWWSNIRNGFEFDQNLFSTNVIDHTYHGTAFFNASRSNGIDFWWSVPMTLLGSFTWECCAEKNAMSINDLVNTTFGGIALGEALYRSSSMVLSNEATGGARAGREIAGFVINPIRGFNRLFSGRMFRVEPNPSDPNDRTPDFFRLSLDAGYRAVEPDYETRETVHDGFLRLRMDSGSPFSGRRRGPFDVFEFDVTLYSGDRNILGSVAVRGNLLTRDLKRGRSSDHVWAVVQSYEYDDTDAAFQFGDQNIGVRLESLWRLGGGSSALTRLQGGVIVLGTLEAAFEPTGDSPPDWRPRAFDYTSGFDGRFEGELHVGRFQSGLAWRSMWMTTLNDDAAAGGGADHWLHQGKLSARLLIGPHLRLGTELRLWIRDSGYSIPFLGDVNATVPELRVYGTWVLAPGRRGASPFVF